jgi:hypothetical protein
LNLTMSHISQESVELARDILSKLGLPEDPLRNMANRVDRESATDSDRNRYKSGESAHSGASKSSGESLQQSGSENRSFAADDNPIQSARLCLFRADVLSDVPPRAHTCHLSRVRGGSYAEPRASTESYTHALDVWLRDVQPYEQLASGHGTSLQRNGASCYLVEVTQVLTRFEQQFLNTKDQGSCTDGSPMLDLSVS